MTKVILFAIVTALGLGCDDDYLYVCEYKGKEYKVGESWTDECRWCQCPSQGAKRATCDIGPPCPSSATDGAADGDTDASASDQ